jgi:hypothetical protein
LVLRVKRGKLLGFRRIYDRKYKNRRQADNFERSVSGSPGNHTFFIVTGANTSIRSVEREQRGLSCLRSITELLRIASGDPENIQPEIVDSANFFLRKMEREYAAIGAASPEGETLVRQIGNDFMILWNTGWDTGGYYPSADY